MKKLIQILENVCAFLLCLLALSVLFQIIARFMRIPATWTTEVARSLFHIIVFLGMPIIIYENSQMAVTMVKDLFKHNRVVTLIFDIISDIFVYFLLITLIYGSYNRTVAEWNTVIPSLPGITSGHLYLVMLIGAVLMLAAQIVRTKIYLTGKDNKEDC